MAQQSNNSSTCLIIAAIGAAMFMVMLVCGGILVGLTLPAVQAAREAARRMQCSNNLKQLAFALHNYHDAYKSFPPAYTVDDQGNRLHSWRTLILPYLEQKGLYDQIDFSKPWNHADNQLAMDTIVPSFHCPSSSLPTGHTTYMTVVDPQGVFSGSTPTTLGKITDGTANTLLVVEGRANQSVHWMAPNDLDASQFIDSLKRPSVGQDHSPHTAGGNIVLSDGSVQFISNAVDPATIQAMVTKDGGEITSLK
jgi:Protein of unknown function (DUF1559)